MFSRNALNEFHRQKHIIILEGADACGKTQLSQYFQNDIANGKCHILHSNFNKAMPENNHYRQHKLITKFVKEQFDVYKYYTGNNIVILDRNYISDIIYGDAINCGSRGSITKKYKRFLKILKKLNYYNDVTVNIIYCRPTKSAFNRNDKDELPTVKQNELIQQTYDDFFGYKNAEITSSFFKAIDKTYGIKSYIYDFTSDSNYIKITKEIFKIKG